MTAQTIIVIIAVAILSVLAISQLRRGPSVAQIDRTVWKNRKDAR